MSSDVYSVPLPSLWWLGALAVATLAVAHLIAAWMNHARDVRVQEKLRKLSNTQGSRIPVTLVTGFLGSGKTHLLNRILANPLGHRILVIENEAGAVSIDHALLRASESTGNELERTLDRLLLNADDADGNPRFDYVVVETSGLVDPVPLLETFFRDDVAGRYFIDGVITVVDAKNIAYHLDGAGMLSRGKESGRQVAVADVVLLNKVDLVDEHALAVAKAAIASTNMTAKVLPCTYADVPMSSILDQQAFSGAAALVQRTPGPRASSHTGRVHTISITHPCLASGVPLERLQPWLRSVVSSHWRRLYRVKGLLRVTGRITDDGNGAAPDVPTSPATPASAAAPAASVRWFLIHGVHADVHARFVEEDELRGVERHDGHTHADDEPCADGGVTPALVLIGPDLADARLEASFFDSVCASDDAAAGSETERPLSRARRRDSRT